MSEDGEVTSQISNENNYLIAIVYNRAKMISKKF